MLARSVDADALAGQSPGPLDLHEEISDPAARGCRRWPETLRLLNHSTGELKRGRCGATNLCDYCARLGAVENSELLALDALAGNAPQLWAVLTTRTASIEPRRFYRSREQVWKALRRRWPSAEYAALVEFTTGYGPRSGGARRPHWNLLIKGIPVEHLEEARAVITRIWCAREDAEPWAQFVEPIGDAGHVLRYVALHFQKESQRPPRGWRGHRFLKSHGYLQRPTAEVRADARRSLRVKRLIHAGSDAQTAELEVAIASATVWELRPVRPETYVLREVTNDRDRSALERTPLGTGSDGLTHAVRRA